MQKVPPPPDGSPMLSNRHALGAALVALWQRNWGQHSSEQATQPLCGQSTLEALGWGVCGAESSGQHSTTASHTRTHTQTHGGGRKKKRERDRAGFPQGRAESYTMFSWYNMMKVNWNTLCRTATERDVASAMISFKHEGVWGFFVRALKPIMSTGVVGDTVTMQPSIDYVT